VGAGVGVCNQTGEIKFPFKQKLHTYEQLHPSSFFYPRLFKLSIKYGHCITILPFGNSKYIHIALNKQTNWERKNICSPQDFCITWNSHCRMLGRSPTTESAFRSVLYDEEP